MTRAGWIKKAALALLLFALAARGGTTAPTADELMRMKRDLEGERAQLQAERAKFEADKASWEAHRAAARVAAQAPLYFAREPARLYQNSQIAGEVPAGAIVPGVANPKYDGWLLVRHNGGTYDAEAKSFSDASAVLAATKQQLANAKARRDQMQDQLDDLRMRRAQLEQLIATLESAKGQTIVVMPPPSRTQAAQLPPMLVFNNDSSGGQSAKLRNELRDDDRELEKMQKQLQPLVQEQSRAEAALQRIQQGIETARNAAL